MRRLTDRFIRSTRDNRRFAPIAAVTWGGDSGTSPLILSSEPIPPECLAAVRWAGQDDFDAGTHDGTYTGIDDDGRAFIGLLPDGPLWGGWKEIDDDLQTDYLYGAWIWRHDTTGRIHVIFRQYVTSFPMHTYSDDGGQTWSTPENLHTAYPLIEWDAARVNCVNLGDVVILPRDPVAISTDDGVTWASYSSSSIWGSSHLVQCLYSTGERIYAIGRRIADDIPCISYTTDGSTWSSWVEASGLASVPAGYISWLPTGACYHRGVHIAVGAIRDTGSPVTSERVGIWRCWDEYGVRWELADVLDSPFRVGDALAANIRAVSVWGDPTRTNVHITMTGPDPLVPYPAWYPISYGVWIDTRGPINRLADDAAIEPLFAATAFSRSFWHCRGYQLATAQYGPDKSTDTATTYATMLAWPLGSSGTWTSQAKDSQSITPQYGRVELAEMQPTGSAVSCAFRSAAVYTGVSSATWVPSSAGGFNSGDDASALPSLQYCQSRVVLSSTGGQQPRCYAVGLKLRNNYLQDPHVTSWGTWRLEVGEFDAQLQAGTIELALGPSQAAYWPWQSALVRVGLLPLDGDWRDIVWLAAAPVARTAVTGDTLTLWLGESSECAALVERRIDIPASDRLGWPGGSYIPYVLGDFTALSWADEPAFFGSGEPHISPVYADDDAAGADWVLTYAASTDTWTATKDGGTQTAPIRWGQSWESDGGEVRLTISPGDTLPTNGSEYRFRTYRGGSLPAARVGKRRYALGLGSCSVSAVWDGTSLIDSSAYNIGAGRINGIELTWADLDAPPSGTVTWSGRGERWNGVDTEWAHEHARQIVHRWGRAHWTSSSPDSWVELIDRSSWKILALAAREIQAETRLVITQPDTVRSALTRLLMGWATWTIEGMGRIRFQLLTGWPSQLTIPERFIRSYPQWQGPGAQSLRSEVEVTYDGFRSSGSAPSVRKRVRRVERAMGRVALAVDDQYPVVCECIVRRRCAELIADVTLGRVAVSRESVNAQLPLPEFAAAELGDWLTYTSRDVPDTANRDASVTDRGAIVRAIEYDLDGMTVTVDMEHRQTAPTTEEV